MGVRVSGHILFAVFRLPFGCKIPPHHTANIINAKKIRFDGRTPPPTRTPTASKRTPASREPCAVFRLSVSRERVSASEYSPPPPPPPQKTPPKHTPHQTTTKTTTDNPPTTTAENGNGHPHQTARKTTKKRANQTPPRPHARLKHAHNTRPRASVCAYAPARS